MINKINKFKKFKYGLIVVSKDDNKKEIYHFVGYWGKPTEIDKKSLYEELSTDVELGLIDEMKDLKIIDANKKVVDYFNNLIKDQEKMG